MEFSILIQAAKTLLKLKDMEKTMILAIGNAGGNIAGTIYRETKLSILN